jgi:hypothetical protein
MTRLARHVAIVLRKNPDLTDRQAANAARLLLRDEMTQLAKRSVAVRRGEILDAGGLADAGEQ